MPYKPKIVTRTLTTTAVTEDLIPKNAGLTNSELDSNFLNIRDASIGIAADDSTVIDIGLGNTLKVVGAGGTSTSVSGQTLTITAGSASTGDLTFIGSTISSPSNANLKLTTSGQGAVEIHDASLVISDPGAENEAQGEVARIGPTQVDFNHNGNQTSTFSIYGDDGQSQGGVIPFQVNMAQQASVKINNMLFPATTGSNGQVLTTNGSYTLSWQTPPSLGNLTVSNYTISSGGANLVLDAATAQIVMNDQVSMADTSTGVKSKIVDLAQPTEANDAATNLYVDKAALAFDNIPLTPGSPVQGINRNTSGYVKVTLTTNGTINAIQNFGTGQTLQLLVIQDATGNRTLTFTPAIKWEGGSFPGLSTAANKRDIITLFHSGEADSDAIHGSIRKNFA